MRACGERGIEAVIPGSRYKKRPGGEKEKRYGADDFSYREGEGKLYTASVKGCRPCQDYTRRIRSKKDKKRIDEGRSLLISKSNEQGSLCREMRKKMDTEEYQEQYAQRIQIIEPVFADIEYCIEPSVRGLNRFTVRGKKKVNGQLQLYCIVHNLGKCLKGYNKKRGYA